MFDPNDLQRFRVQPGTKVDLRAYPTDWAETREARKLGKEAVKKRALHILEKNRAELTATQEIIYASDTYSVLIVFQAMDAAGKDGTIRHVMSGVNPQGCQVFSFKRPSAEELDHDFLWRYAKCLPERGRIGIFNRSYYEEVLVVKVHPELVSRQLPSGKRDKAFWAARYEDINGFERHVVRNGTIVLKFFLHLSKEEQRRRFLARLDDPKKEWKYSAADLAEREYWDAYQKAYEDALTATSTAWAPWHVIPADRKYVARALVADVIATAVRDLGLQYPQVSKEERKALAEARAQLEREGEAKRAKKPSRE
jgi:PPK2 family polyphosphate:nucleotide phosphotransferase